jgi:hypothetical protein
MSWGYFSGENGFMVYAASQIVSAPELGFMFPASITVQPIYTTLFLFKKTPDRYIRVHRRRFPHRSSHSAEEQEAAFQTALTEALETNCSFDVVQSVHEQIRERIVQHKESKNPDSL